MSEKSKDHITLYRCKNQINFVAVVSANYFVIEEKFWVVDSGTIKYICVNRNAFISYIDGERSENCVCKQL